MADKGTAITTEFVNCNLCGGDKFSILLRFDRQTVLSPSTTGLDIPSMDVYPSVVRCRKCGLVFVNPRWIFSAGVMPYSEKAEEVYFETTHTKRIFAYNRLIEQIMKRYRLSTLRAIDVGCGDGIMLEVCDRAGVDCDGFEISDALVQQLRNKFGQERIRTGTLELIPEKTYEVVFMINVIEHLSDPKLTLRQIFNILKPGGLILIHAPNMGGLPARMLGARWHQIEPLGHLYYYDRRTLEETLSKVGLQPEGYFHLESTSGIKRAMQEGLEKFHLHIDNGLGVIGKKAGKQVKA